MVAVILVVVVALVLVSAGVFAAVRISARARHRGGVAGEPLPAPAREVETPSVEELEELLRAPEVEVAPPPEPEVVERPRLRDRLARTRGTFSGAFGRMRGRKIDDETWDELEESLLLADVGMVTTTRLLDALRSRAKEQSVTEPDALIALLRDEVVALLDTAGRLHTKTNLMEELKKLRRIVDRTPGALKEVLLVIDAATGQNGLVQAKQFAEAVDVTGIALTKLDGTAKGGIVIAIQAELGIPVKIVGVGEGVGDLIEFDPHEFAAALFADD